MKNLHIALLCGALFLFAGTQKIFAQAGSPDLTFGTNGLVTTDINLHDEAYSLALQPDGKILAAGFNTNSNEDFTVVRYNPNGSLDPSFGTGGIATTDFGSGNDRAYEVLLQPDGKIVLVGYAFGLSGNSDFALARFLSNGTLDTSFGNLGKVTTDLTGNYDYAFAGALQPDGKILASGPIGVGDIGIVRYNTDGTLDNTFNSTGILDADLNGGYNCVFTLLVQPDNKIVVSGFGFNNIDYDFSIARFNPDGSFDNTFGTNGQVLTPVGPAEDKGNGMVLQPDGKIIVVGHSWNAATTDTEYGMVRYNSDGSLDLSFGTNGIARGPLSNTYDYLNAVTLQPDGKIVASGQTSTPGFTDLALVRFNTNGTLDTSFNGTGIVARDVFGQEDIGNAVLMQPDGKILMAGSAQISPEVDFVVARYLSDLNLQTVNFTELNGATFIYPNPVSENSVLEYSLTQAEEISIEIFDAQGKLVSTLQKNQLQTEGQHQQQLNLPNNLASGTYFIVLSTAQGKVSVEIVK